ncbi:MAG: STAS domain-containing protein [Nitrospinae bacterium]|nr:STAS domain-containing protein [Nitrospinota bacterium]
MEKIHKEILGLMGKIDIDCRDEKDTIIIDLAGQLDVYNSQDLNLLVDAYKERGYKKFITNLKKVTYLDSSTISVFIQCHQILKDGGDLYWPVFRVPLKKFLIWQNCMTCFKSFLILQAQWPLAMEAMSNSSFGRDKSLPT